MDTTEQLKDQVDQALAQGTSLEIRGGHSKGFYGRQPEQALPILTTSAHSGVVYYEPTELVMTARAGTHISEINAILAEHRQQLAFEPPEMNCTATLGGTMATGLSGPARPWAGAARDHILGVRIINGRGQVLRFGGEVMKNVAGYDVSRLMVGAMGTLGVILDASFRVVPIPETRTTLILSMNRKQSLEFMADVYSKPLPITGTAWFESNVYLRLGGSEAHVQVAIQQLGGDVMSEGDQFWHSLREYRHPFLLADSPLWRLGLPPHAQPDLPGDTLIDWGGTQWWLSSEAPPEAIRKPIHDVGGHATLFRGGDRQGNVFQPLSPGMAALQERIRCAFDPNGIFNPGRISPGISPGTHGL